MRYIYESSYLLSGWFDSDLTIEGWFGEEFAPDAGPPPSSPIIESIKTLWAAATTAYNVDLPAAPLTGDVWWVQFQNADTVGSFTTVPSGWTEQVPVLHATGGNMITCYSHVVTSGEEASPPATANFVWANSLAGNALLTVVRGVDAAILDVAYASVTNGTTAKTVPSITTVTDDAIILGGGQLQSATTQSINVPASGWTQLLSSCGDSAGRGGVLGFKEVQAVAGATGTAAFTQTSALQGYAYQVALRPSAGLTAVGKDLQLIWNQQAVVADTLQLVWNNRANVADTLQLVWNNRVNVADTLQLVWNNLTSVNKTLQMLWNDNAVVNKDLQLLWNVLELGLTAVGKDLQLIWNMNASVGDTLQLVWNDRAVATKNLQLVWNVRTTVNKTLQLIWNDRSLVSKDIQLIWNARSPVGKTAQLVWNVNTPIGKTLQVIWNNRANVGDTVQLVWNVRSATGKDLILVWNVNQNVAWIEAVVPGGSWSEQATSAATYAEQTVAAGSYSEVSRPDGTWVEVVVNPNTWS